MKLHKEGEGDHVGEPDEVVERQEEVADVEC